MVSALFHLSLQFSHIKAEYLFLRVIGRLKSLTQLNGVPVTETDAAAALRLVAGTRISQVISSLKIAATLLVASGGVQIL